MNNSVFNIKDLQCQYQGTLRPVLEIDELSIEKKDIVFFIGASGIGKSTILETLGLMNNTLKANPNSIFKFTNENKEDLDLLKIWQASEKAIAEFRRKYMSFIFQSTNLFSTLTAFENVLITPLLQGVSRAEAIEKAKDIFKKVKLDDQVAQKNITHLSGGQKQRLAFARAIVTNASVLFADEPTGNLDLANASILMKVLIDIIKEKEKTAIIVSHDINLALNYATKIVLIDKMNIHINNSSYSIGKISTATTFTKQLNNTEWGYSNSSVYTPEQMSNHLKNSLQKQAGIDE